MKILHTVKLYHPSTGGMYEVVKQLSERLVNFGHDLTVATIKLPNGYQINLHGVKIKEFKISGNYINGIKGDISKYQKFLIDSNFDIITNFAAQQPMTDLTLPILNQIKAKKIFVPTGFAAFYEKKYREYYKKMAFWFKNYDANIFLSNDYRDINYAKKNNAKNITIITNGASKEEFQNTTIANIRKKLNICKNYFLILHVGSHTGLKGHNEAIKIFLEANIKKAILLIVGNPGQCLKNCENKAKKLNASNNFITNNKKIIIKKLTRIETVQAYHTADLFLFPSNAECSPVVLFECMASKTPFLTTDAGNAKEIINWSGGGLLLPTNKSYNPNISLPDKLKTITKKIICSLGLSTFNIYSYAKIKEAKNLLEYLYNTPSKRNHLAESGHTAWLEKFTWEKISRDYENLYLNLINK